MAFYNKWKKPLKYSHIYPFNIKMLSEEFIRKHYISEKDIQICYNCTTAQLDIQNNKEEVLTTPCEIQKIYQQE